MQLNQQIPRSKGSSGLPYIGRKRVNDVRKTEIDTAEFDPVRGAGASSGKSSVRSQDRAKLARSSFQTTLGRAIEVEGIGLHQGETARLVMKPAEAGTGIVFRRTDLSSIDRNLTDIPARYDTVSGTTMCTVLGNEKGTTVATVEHLMAALAACGVDNLLIEVSGPEVPVMDGSSAPFVKAIRQAGVRELEAPCVAIRILKPVIIEEGLKRAELLPGDGFAIEFDIDFDNAAIGKQSYRTEITEELFAEEISEARTFGFYQDYEALKAMGLAKGGSLDNAVVIDGETVMNDDGLRYADEFVRHKVLDAVGDLSLAGAPIVGLYRGVRAGHALNNQILRALFAAPDAWDFVSIEPQPALAARALAAAMPAD